MWRGIKIISKYRRKIMPWEKEMIDMHGLKRQHELFLNWENNKVKQMELKQKSKIKKKREIVPELIKRNELLQRWKESAMFQEK